MTGMLSASLPIDLRQDVAARRAAKAKPWSVSVLREITAEDLVLLYSSTQHLPDNPKAPLTKIRNPHHMLAQAVAKGIPRVEIAAVYGYTPARIKTLELDPAFQELVAHYAEQEVFAQADIAAQVKHVSMAANEILMERLESEPESFSNKDLRELRDAGLDRTGHGPSSKLDVQVNDPSGVIAQLRQMLNVESKTRILDKRTIDAEYVEIKHDKTPAR